MKAPKMPKTVQQWADKNKDKVQELFLEEDCAFDGGDWSIWCYLKEGFVCASTECGTIHEPLAKDFLEATRSIMTKKDYEDRERKHLDSLINREQNQ